jgi:hypothetical protein
MRMMSLVAYIVVSPFKTRAAAEALADTFLNARFALALLIAGVVYYWRFDTGRKVFGAQRFDYVEAFALGFVVNAVVANLSASIAQSRDRVGSPSAFPRGRARRRRCCSSPSLRSP